MSFPPEIQPEKSCPVRRTVARAARSLYPSWRCTRQLAAVLLMTLLAVAACKKPPTIGPAAPFDTTALGVPVAPALDFAFLTSRARFTYRSEAQNLTATATIRMEKDRRLWVSVSPGLGIEVLRCLITPDSVLVVDRYNKKNYRYDYATLQKKLNFQLNYELLQSALLGNLPFPEQAPTKVTTRDNFVLFVQRVGELKVENYLSDVNGKLARVVAEENGSGNLMELFYTDYAPLANGLFPNENRVALTTFQASQTAKTEVEIRHQRVETSNDDPGFSFDFPGAYPWGSE